MHGIKQNLPEDRAQDAAEKGESESLEPIARLSSNRRYKTRGICV